MAKLTEYPAGTTFPNPIGRTVDESSPAWPSPNRTKEGTPNVLFIVIDDTGFGQLGAYGGLVKTPNIDKFAQGGLKYTDVHTTAICSATRSCVLTGRNHHTNAMAAVSEASTGFPGYNGEMPFENGMLSEILLDAGFNTYAVGKWHLTPPQESSPAGPYHHWPLGRGFERYYGFLMGETNQWFPDLTYDNHSVQPTKTPEEGYHLTPDLVDHALKFVQDGDINAPDKPFFLYFCPGAGHAPHHVPKEWADKYKGVYDMGWDKLREVTFANQKKMGMFPEDTELSPRDPDVPEWDSLSDDQKKLYTRQMEVWAGFMAHLDHHLGRLIDGLEAMGKLDNTLVMLISDNGASSEGGQNGAFNEMSSFNFYLETVDDILPKIDQLGSPTSYPHYAWGWAWAGNTPFRRWKKEVYKGGSTDMFLVHWPKGIKAKDEFRNQYMHAIDMVPTVLDVLGIEPPKAIKGVTQSPMHGVSLAQTFDDAKAPSKHKTQYFEMLGCRGIYHDGWQAECGWPGPSYTVGKERGYEVGGLISADTLNDLDSKYWELYHVEKDPAEVHDLSKKHPEKLQEMIGRWYAEAGKYDVFPIDGSIMQRMSQARPQLTADRTTFKFYQGASEMPAGTSPPLYNRPYLITTEVEIPKGGAEGVLFAQGGLTGGYTLFIKDKKLHYVHNFLGMNEYAVVSDKDVPEGKLTIRFEFETTGKPDRSKGEGAPGTGKLFFNDTLAGSGKIDRTVGNFYGEEGASCGYDFGETVSKEYESPFPFTGKINSLKVDMLGEDVRDWDAHAAKALAQD